MLTKEQYIEAYGQLTASCYPIWDWKYDENLQVISSNCNHESLFHQLMMECEIEKAISKHRAQSDLPFIYICDSTLCWIVAFEKDQGNIYIKGPFFDALKDSETYDGFLQGHDLSPEAKDVLKESFLRLSAIPSNIATVFALMLHYAIRQESLTEQDIAFRVTERHRIEDTRVATDQLQRQNKHWEMEDEILDKVRRGDTNISGLMEKFAEREPEIPENLQKNINYGRQNINMLLSLISRAAVEGGLPRKTSFAICGQYRRRINASSTTRELQALGNEALTEYVHRVSSMKKYRHCSKQIQLCCEYINNHPEEKITLNYLADRIGYTPYHLSRKFKQEMGCALVDYIQDVKIERAQFLLRTREMAVDEIAADLNYASGSYFSSVFRKKTGESPSEYRKKHEII
ncbi:MAG: helix-turn-helix transcriptional regulator [Oscillospiraceae bacterium]